MTLPYLILPLCIGYLEGWPHKVVDARFTPNMISSYHAGYLTDAPAPDTLVTTFIYHGTQVFQIAMSVEEFENAIRGYWDMVTKKQSIKEKLKIVN